MPPGRSSRGGLFLGGLLPSRAHLRFVPWSKAKILHFLFTNKFSTFFGVWGEYLSTYIMRYHSIFYLLSPISYLLSSISYLLSSIFYLLSFFGPSLAYARGAAFRGSLCSVLRTSASGAALQAARPSSVLACPIMSTVVHQSGVYGINIGNWIPLF